MFLIANIRPTLKAKGAVWCFGKCAVLEVVYAIYSVAICTILNSSTMNALSIIQHCSFKTTNNLVPTEKECEVAVLLAGKYNYFKRNSKKIMIIYVSLRF
jgi:hypothetical protein